jgi:DNA (cytosine-5)-methyltransferase 1
VSITFGSVCSGIEAASVAFKPLGWRAAWLAEIEPFPCAVLAHHYPDVPNLGDMTTIARRVLTGEVAAPDVLCGGTPCQAFSVAGLRESLSDARGNLTLKFVELADAIDHVRARAGKPAAIILWENVPGVLSTKDNAFGCFLAGLAGEDEPLVPPGKRWEDAGCVYGPRRAIAWRTLDAQYFGLAQRRRRVFVVASARDGFDPAEVLFEWEGVRRDSPPSRSSKQSVAGTVAGGARKRGGYSSDDIPLAGTLTSHAKGDNAGQESKLVAFGGNQTSGPRDIASALSAHGGACGRMDFESETFITQHAYVPEVAATMVARSSRGGGQTNSPGHQADSELIAFDTTQVTSKTNRSQPKPGDPCHPLAAGAHAPAIAFDCKASGQNGFGVGEIAGTQRAMGHANSHTNGGGHQAALVGSAVRRLMPEECELLQGFKQGYTRIEWRGRPADECPDGPRYKALGNSWAVPCAGWIGGRIDRRLRSLEVA